ncbi:putative Ser/Thr protein kinase [Spinactinospora alkalitolerans]|uniref:Putative Ser/Thr protein kinase n=1 Tax=Spinactinospora alkalitolerans TaxID=687207 RepID=A0A852TY95_9ACTN|nr:protein kinase [Spinactinospora alkalitolerans]NYE48969.1 putative Ser/Thr protein kinase [Spinactinospora alkalitolerans]
MSHRRPLRHGDPDRIGGYRLTHRLGQGGQGTVFLGVGAGGEEVALKTLNTELAQDPGSRQRFEREAAAARRVASFCTAQVLAADFAAVPPYIVSEYVEGPSLKDDVAARGPRSGAALHRLAVTSVTALVAIHEAGIVHRDFKPANVLLAADGPRVIDFGIARVTDNTGTMTGAITGTPAYMAPEQITGRSAIGAPADVYAWGAVMVYAATGHAAFAGDSVPMLMHRVLHEEPDLSGLDGDWHHLVTACLNRDPRLRPTAHNVLMRLVRWQRGGAPAAPGPAAAPAPAPARPEQPMGMAAPTGEDAPTGPRGDGARAGADPVDPTARPTRRRGTGLVLTGAATAVLLVAGGLTGAYALTRDDDPVASAADQQSAQEQAAPEPSASESAAEPTPSAEASAQTSIDPSPSAQDEESAADDAAEEDGETEEDSAEPEPTSFPASYAGTWMGRWPGYNYDHWDFRIVIPQGGGTGQFSRLDGKCDAAITVTGAADNGGYTATLNQTGPECTTHTTGTIRANGDLMDADLHPSATEEGLGLQLNR